MCNKICSKTRKYACNGGNHRSSSILLMYFVYGFNKTKRMNTSYQMLKRLIVHRFLVYCSLSLCIFIVYPYVYEHLTPSNNIHTIQNTHTHTHYFYDSYQLNETIIITNKSAVCFLFIFIFVFMCM